MVVVIMSSRFGTRVRSQGVPAHLSRILRWFNTIMCVKMLCTVNAQKWLLVLLPCLSEIISPVSKSSNFLANWDILQRMLRWRCYRKIRSLLKASAALWLGSPPLPARNEGLCPFRPWAGCWLVYCYFNLLPLLHRLLLPHPWFHPSYSLPLTNIVYKSHLLQLRNEAELSAEVTVSTFHNFIGRYW